MQTRSPAQEKRSQLFARLDREATSTDRWSEEDGKNNFGNRCSRQKWLDLWLVGQASIPILSSISFKAGPRFDCDERISALKSLLISFDRDRGMGAIRYLIVATGRENTEKLTSPRVW